jgi:two-component system chemotaxis response regulator CheY
VKILLIDDSRTMRNIEKNVLKALENVTFVEAADGVEALGAVAAETMQSGGSAGFDLILADWNMPNMDGITFVRRFREKDKRTPIVMVTTEAERTAILDAIRAGVNDYVVKPFTPPDLLQRVNRTLAKYASAKTAAA